MPEDRFGKFPGLTADKKSDGQAVYTISLLAHRPYLLLRGEISYPASDRNDIIKADEPGLSRRLDMRWREVAPAEIQFSPEATRQHPPRILKRNYLGVETHYALDYFRHAPENLNLDNVNNHITQSYVGIVSGEYGMAIATDTTVQGGFVGLCPPAGGGLTERAGKGNDAASGIPGKNRRPIGGDRREPICRPRRQVSISQNATWPESQNVVGQCQATDRGRSRNVVAWKKGVYLADSGAIAVVTLLFSLSIS